MLLSLIGLAALATPAVLLTRDRSATKTDVTTATALSTAPGGHASTAPSTPPSGRTSPAPAPSGHVAGAPPKTNPSPDRPSQATLARMLGQMIVARFAGLEPSRSFLERIESGQIGGVILFGDNLTPDPATTRALTKQLQLAARRGGNPPLLIMTDQEGGEVRRLPGPPTAAPAAMDSATVALQQGQATGRLLRSVGINVDLAPVADVQRVQGSFLGTRAFGGSPTVVASRACAFAKGLAAQRVAYTLKHFPGLGMAVTSTDSAPVSIDAPAAQLRDDYLAYLTCASHPLALVMVSSAIYPSLTGPLPAVMSRLTYQRELRLAVPGATPPTISDDLQTPALADQTSPARDAINAGLDMAMYAGTEDGSAEAYRVLRADLAHGELNVDRVRAAARAVAALKRKAAPSGP